MQQALRRSTCPASERSARCPMWRHGGVRARARERDGNRKACTGCWQCRSGRWPRRSGQRAIPKRSSGSSLINTSMRPFARIGERLRPAALPALARRGGGRVGVQCEAIIHRLTCNRHDTAAADLAAWTAIRTSSPVSAASALRQLWGGRAVSCAEYTVAMSDAAAVIGGGQARRSRVLGADRNAMGHGAHAEHPWAGHDLPHDDPAWTCRTIGKFRPRSVDMSIRSARKVAKQPHSGNRPGDRSLGNATHGEHHAHADIPGTRSSSCFRAAARSALIRRASIRRFPKASRAGMGDRHVYRRHQWRDHRGQPPQNRLERSRSSGSAWR